MSRVEQHNEFKVGQRILFQDKVTQSQEIMFAARDNVPVKNF